MLQSVPHCTATAAPQLIRRRRKKKIARIDPIPIDRTPKSYFPDFKKKFSFHFPFVGLIKVLCCVFLSKSSFMFPFHVNRELQNPRIYSRGGNSCGFRDTDKYLQQENIFFTNKYSLKLYAFVCGTTVSESCFPRSQPFSLPHS